MTPDELRALADRAVACRHFYPMRGMRDLQGRTWTPDLLWRWNRTVDRPDLSDPATLGCLLALVREAWGDECACVLPVDYGPGDIMWVCQLTAGGRSLTARHWATEAEALVAALEAAP